MLYRRGNRWLAGYFHIMICCRAARRGIHNRRLRSYTDGAATAPWVWDCGWGFGVGGCLGGRRGSERFGDCLFRLWFCASRLLRLWSLRCVLDEMHGYLSLEAWSGNGDVQHCVHRTPYNLQADVTYQGELVRYWRLLVMEASSGARLAGGG